MPNSDTDHPLNVNDKAIRKMLAKPAYAEKIKIAAILSEAVYQEIPDTSEKPATIVAFETACKIYL